jgi:hypothetical protein
MAKDLEAIPSSLSMQYPTTRELHSILRKILRRMKLEHLYLIPWDIQDGTYLDFYNGRIDPRFFATVRGKPAEWDLEFVGDSFQLPLEGHGFLSQKDPLSERYFSQDKVVSHGYKISQCKDPELMMLFHFLIPILHPRKPSYIPVKWANIVIASWSGEREINWAFIMHKVIQDEVRALGPKKLCSLPSYLAQLYAYGDYQLVIERHHRVLVRRVIKEVYGTSEDELTDEEEATYEETKEESTEVPLEDYGETEGGDQSFLHELISAIEYKYDGTFDGNSSSGLTGF